MSFASTPYEGQRRRVRWMEWMEAARLAVPLEIARAGVGRAVRLSPHQLVNIRKRKLKKLDGDVSRRIDEAFVAWAQKLIGDLEHELVRAHASAQGIDQGLVDKAKTSIDVLQQLIEDAERAGVTNPASGDNPIAPGIAEDRVP